MKYEQQRKIIGPAHTHSAGSSPQRYDYMMAFKTNILVLVIIIWYWLFPY